MLGHTRFIALAFSLGLGVPTAALAQGTAAVPTKVGIVQIQEAIAATKDGQKELSALQARFAPKQNDLKALKDEVDNLTKQLQAQSDKLNNEERAARVKAIESKQKVLQRNYEDFQNEAQQAQQEMVGRLGNKMLSVLEAYAKTNGYAMVLDVSNPQTPVLYASEATNITKQLVDAYDAQSPAAPASKPAGGAAANKPAGPAPPAKQP